MRKLMTATVMTVALVGASALGTVAVAGERIDPAALPGAVTASLERHFPGHRVIEAERERDDGRIEYEVKISHGNIVLEVELAEDGRILDVDKD